MAATRTINERVEYNLEKRMNNGKLGYLLDSSIRENNSGCRMFDLGGLPALNSANLSYNNIDMESKLRGIKSCNLEGSNFNPSLQSKQIQSLPLFERQSVHLPPAIIHHTERHGFHNI